MKSNKPVGTSGALILIALLTAFAIHYESQRIGELEKELNEAKEVIQRLTPEAPQGDGNLAQIVPMEPDEDRNHRFMLRIFHLSPEGKRYPLVKGNVDIISQWKNSREEKFQGISMCGYRLSIKGKTITDLTSDCVLKFEKGSGEGEYIITEKGSRKSATIASVSFDSEWKLEEIK